MIKKKILGTVQQFPNSIMGPPLSQTLKGQEERACGCCFYSWCWFVLCKGFSEKGTPPGYHGWRFASVVKRTSCRGTEFSFQYPQGSSQPFNHLHRHQAHTVHIDTHRQNVHTHKIKISNFLKLSNFSMQKHTVEYGKASYLTALCLYWLPNAYCLKTGNQRWIRPGLPSQTYGFMPAFMLLI